MIWGRNLCPWCLFLDSSVQIKNGKSFSFIEWTMIGQNISEGFQNILLPLQYIWVTPNLCISFWNKLISSHHHIHYASTPYMIIRCIKQRLRQCSNYRLFYFLMTPLRGHQNTAKVRTLSNLRDPPYRCK